MIEDPYSIFRKSYFIQNCVELEKSLLEILVCLSFNSIFKLK